MRLNSASKGSIVATAKYNASLFINTGVSMPIYVLLSTLTSKGRETVKERPERIKEVNKEVEALGAKILAQYAVLGPYDFVTIIEAPDNETVARISVELGSRGTVQIMSLPAIPIDEFIAKISSK